MNSKIRSLLAGGGLVASAIAFPDAKANAVRGNEIYDHVCTGCHSVEYNRTGPMHRGVVARRVGGVPTFRYSPALKGSKLVWNAKLLSRWLANPEALFPGQDMGYRVVNAQDRADLIDYLTTLKAKR